MSDKPADVSPTLRVTQTPSYREGYANSVQLRMSVWDFQLVFGTMKQDAPDQVDLANFQGVYLSPQQAKALWTLLGANLQQYEQVFGKLALEPVQQTPSKIQIIPVTPVPGGPVN